MDLILYGMNHNTAPIEIRELMSFRDEDSLKIMSGLCSTGIFMENVMLCTCNRTEIYGIAERVDDSLNRFRELISEFRNFGSDSFDRHSYLHLNMNAVEHLFRVSAGIDSMVLGEVEILGQLKDAYRNAAGAEATGPYLNKLFHHCFRVGKKIRNKTGISEGGISVGSSAVELARRVLGHLGNKKALLIGAGDTGRLVAKHLAQAGMGEIVVTNRTVSRAEEIADEINGTVLPFNEYRGSVADFDLIITAVGSGDKTIRRDMLYRRQGLFPLMIDLGVPRDIDPEIEKLPGAILYHIDDLKEIVKEHTEKRAREIEQVEEIIREETVRFMAWSDSLRATSTVKDLHRQFEYLKDETLGRWKGRLSPGEYKIADRIAHELIAKILHEPSVNLKGCEIESGKKHCETCELFDESHGGIHGHYNQELKCIMARLLFGIDSPEAMEELKRWEGSFEKRDLNTGDEGGDLG